MRNYCPHGLSADRTRLILAVYTAGAEVRRLEGLGQVNGPDYVKAVKAQKDAEDAVLSNFRAQVSAGDEAKEFNRQKEELLKENSKLETENKELQRQIDQLKAADAQNKGGVQ